MTRWPSVIFDGDSLSPTRWSAKKLAATLLPVITACTSLLTMLVTLAPAPDSATPTALPTPTAREAATELASIEALSSAVTDTAPLILMSLELRMVALTVSVMTFSASETPMATATPAVLKPMAPASEAAPTSEVMVGASMAETFKLLPRMAPAESTVACTSTATMFCALAPAPARPMAMSEDTEMATEPAPTRESTFSVPEAVTLMAPLADTLERLMLAYTGEAWRLPASS